MNSKSFIIILLFKTMIYSSLVSQEKHPYVSDKPMPFPQKFVIPGTTVAQTITFSPKGDTFYFVTQDAGPIVIKYLAFKNGSWTTPKVGGFCGKVSVEVPFLSPDGSKIFFGCNDDIQMAVKNDTGWNKPAPLSSTINSGNFEGSPAVTNNGKLYFTSSYNGKLVIYCSSWDGNKYSTPKSVGTGINQFDINEIYVTPDESYLLFGSTVNLIGQDDANQDIMISFNKNGTWTKAIKIGSRVNTPEFEGRPCISPDGNYLFFTSHKNKEDYIYQVDWKPILDSLKLITTNLDNSKIEEKKVIVYNHSLKSININLNETELRNSELSIYDLNGRIIKKYNILIENQIQFNSSASGPAIYIATLRNGNQYYANKIIVD